MNFKLDIDIQQGSHCIIQRRYAINMKLNKPWPLTPIHRGDLILSPAKENDMTLVFLMGQDAWGADYQTEEYLDICYKSEKYRSGNWLILRDSNGTPVSSAICYTIPGHNNSSWIGIGSLATEMNSRKKGYGLGCLSMLIDGYEKLQKNKGFMLFQDVDTKIYSSAGFITAESMGYKGTHQNLLLRAGEKNKQEIEFILKNPPHYF